MGLVRKRIFGSDVDLKVKQKIKNLQKLAEGSPEALESIDTEIRTNFGGAAELSSKTSFARMWTAVEPKMKIEKDPKEFKRELSQHKSNINSKTKKTSRSLGKNLEAFSDWGSPDIPGPDSASQPSKTKTIPIGRKIYALGTNEEEILTKRPITSPMTPVPGGLDQNEHLAPQSGITSVSSQQQGSLGLLKSTTVNFIVGNIHDFDAIYSRYFLRPGALIFIDFGWDLASEELLYAPSLVIQQSEVEGGADLEEIIFGDNGIIENSDNNLEVIIGRVTDYTSKLRENGSYECSLTVKSGNAALMGSHNETTSIKERFFSTIDTEIVNFAAAHFGKKFVNPSSTYSVTDIADYNELSRIFAAQQLSSINVTTLVPGQESEKSGVFYWGGRATAVAVKDDDKSSGVYKPDSDSTKLFIKIGLLEDFILNNSLAIGHTEDIDKDKNFAVKFDSSNSFCGYSKLLSRAQRHGSLGSIPKYFIPGNSYNDSYNTYRDKVPNDRKDEKGKYIDKPPKQQEPDDAQLHPDAPTDVNVITDASSDAPDTWSAYDRAKDRIPIRELYVNLQLVKDSFMIHDSVEAALVEILDSINEDSMHILNLSLYTPSKSDTQLSIIDRNRIEIAAETSANYYDKMLMFSPGSPESIVKNFDLGLSTPKNGLQNMIAIQGSNPEDELFPYDASLANQLSLYILNMDVNQPQFGFSYLPNLAGDTLERITNNNESEDIVRMGALVKKDLIFGNSNSTVKSKLSAIRKNFSYSDSNNSMKDSYTKAYNKANNFDEDLDEESKHENPLSTIEDEEYDNYYTLVTELGEFYKLMAKNDFFGNNRLSNIMPITLNLSIHGISGLHNGDVFRVDYLPGRYAQLVFFQVTKVNHRIDNGGWTTEIESVMRIRSDYNVIFNQSNNITDTGGKITMNKQKLRPPDNLIISKKLLKELGLRIDDYVIENSQGITAESLIKNMKYLKLERMGGFTSPSSIQYILKFKNISSNKFALCKHLRTPVDGKNWKYIEIPKWDTRSNIGNSYEFWGKGDNKFIFGVNGTVQQGQAVSFYESIPQQFGVPLPDSLGLGLNPVFSKNNKFNIEFAANYSSVAGPGKIHCSMHTYNHGNFKLFKGNAGLDMHTCLWNVVVHPNEEYYLFIIGHDWVVVPIGLPLWMYGRIENALNWYDGHGGKWDRKLIASSEI